jgi:glutathione synthase/RimK-type ligase-like ATP-grasp enzyme
MRLLCLDDRGHWGRDLAAVAHARGWEAHLFEAGEPLRPADYAFMRINQGGERMEREKRAMWRIAQLGVRTIPELNHGLLYENKVGQAHAFRDWMPPTRVLTDVAAAEGAIGELGYPFISKARDGSASRNVRLIESEDQARQEIQLAFGSGLPTPHRLGTGIQKGYLIWQQFMGGNAYDYRVIAVGRQRLLLRRHNRPDIPFASGSGLCEPITALDVETAAVLQAANEFFAAAHTNWCGIDLVRAPDSGRWYVLETTLGWMLKAYLPCAFIGTRWTGADIWNVLLDEIEAGVFNVDFAEELACGS